MRRGRFYDEESGDAKRPRKTITLAKERVLLPKCESIDFLNFPREIRDRIYEFVVVDPNLILSSCGYDAETPRFHASSTVNRNVYDLNIFQANRQIFTEARHIFFSRNTFDINIIEDPDRYLRYNFVPTRCDYAIKALRHLKICVQFQPRRSKPAQGEKCLSATIKLEEILYLATDLRTLEVWMIMDKLEEDSGQVYEVLKGVNQLQKLKIVETRHCTSPSSLQGLRSEMLGNPERALSNPVWAAYSRGERAYTTTMCYDDHLGNSLLTREDRRYLQGDEIYEFRGEDMKQKTRLNI